MEEDITLENMLTYLRRRYALQKWMNALDAAYKALDDHLWNFIVNENNSQAPPGDPKERELLFEEWVAADVEYELANVRYDYAISRGEIFIDK